jgi:hypothetical protein
LAACGAAEASTFDAGNPLHCLVAFSSYEKLAELKGDHKLARGIGFRAQWYADQVKQLPEKERSAEASESLAARFLAEKDGGLALATECFRRQDADPAFKAEVARK